MSHVQLLSRTTVGASAVERTAGVEVSIAAKWSAAGAEPGYCCASPFAPQRRAFPPRRISSGGR